MYCPLKLHICPGLVYSYLLGGSAPLFLSPFIMSGESDVGGGCTGDGHSEVHFLQHPQLRGLPLGASHADQVVHRGLLEDEQP